MFETLVAASNAGLPIFSNAGCKTSGTAGLSGPFVVARLATQSLSPSSSGLNAPPRTAPILRLSAS